MNTDLNVQLTPVTFEELEILQQQRKAQAHTRAPDLYRTLSCGTDRIQLWTEFDFENAEDFDYDVFNVRQVDLSGTQDGVPWSVQLNRPATFVSEKGGVYADAGSDEEYDAAEEKLGDAGESTAEAGILQALINGAAPGEIRTLQEELLFWATVAYCPQDTDMYQASPRISGYHNLLDLPLEFMPPLYAVLP